MSQAITQPAWTPAQKRVIEHVEGNLLVSAAAGSGKTAVLAERCALLVTHPDPKLRSSVDRLLVLTFTEAAANEMRQRIGKALRDKASLFSGDQLARQLALVDRASISTIHAFCTKVLRTHFHEANLDPSFEVIDEDEAMLLQHDVLEGVLSAAHANTDAAFAARFTELLEAYAGGNDSTLIGMIQKLDTMLRTLADPQTWLAQARKRYSQEGAEETFASYAQTINKKLRLYAQACGNHLQKIPVEPEYQSLRDNLSGLRDTITVAVTLLDGRAQDSWSRARAILSSFAPQKMMPKPKPADFDEQKKLFTDINDDIKDLYKNGAMSERNTREQILADIRKLQAPIETIIELTRQFQSGYDEAKREQNRIDFADLESHMLSLLTADQSATAKALRERYDHVLVDEFQDTNPLQATLLNAIADPQRYAGKGNLFVVGDVKQSIYSFRLADPSLFLQMEKQRRACTSHDAFIALQNNFRTDPSLLEHMNDIFSRLLTPEVAGVQYADGHQLFPPPGRQATGDNPIELHLIAKQADADEHEVGNFENGDTNDTSSPNDPASLTLTQREAQFAAVRIRQLLTDGTQITDKSGTRRTIRPGDIAILMRSVRNRAPIFARALAEAGIAVYADLSTGYFDTVEVREVLALLAVIDNPCQDIPLTTVMLSRIFPFARFTHDELATIRLAFNRRDVPFYEAVEKYSHYHADHQSPELAEKLAIFFAKIKQYCVMTRTLPLHEALATIYQDSRILVFAAGMQAGPQRVANLQALHQRARQFSSFRRQGLYRFLQFIDRLRDLEGDAGEAPALSEAADVVRVMSVHKSKGLEFPVVIVAGLGNQFNFDRDGPLFVHRREFMGLKLADLEHNSIQETATSYLVRDASKKETRAEELRLLYVALTRARRKLILTGTLKNLKNIEKYRTRFSDHAGALPEEHLLDAHNQLDFLLPLCVSSGFKADWPDQPCATPAVTVRIWQQELKFPDTQQAKESQHPVAAAIPINDMIARIRGDYPSLADCAIPAVMSVSELKRQQEPEGDTVAVLTEEPLRMPEFMKYPADAPAKIDPRIRGTAMHRLLEKINFAEVYNAATLQKCIKELKKTKAFPNEWAELIDQEALIWFFGSPLGQHIRRLSFVPHEQTLWDAPQSVQIHKERSFTYAMPAKRLWPEASAEARISLRGAVDLLLISENSLEIVDYKTDARLTDQALEQYRRQVTLYGEALHAILGKPVRQASLVFLTSRQICPVTVTQPD